MPVCGSFFTKPSTHAPTNSSAASPSRSRIFVRHPVRQPCLRFLTRERSLPIYSAPIASASARASSSVVAQLVTKRTATRPSGSTPQRS